MPLSATYRSRVLGSYYGLLVGDALGAPYEFRKRDSYTPAREYVRCTTFAVSLPEGGWTDDSSMALCLLESLLENQGEWNAANCVEKWIKWRGQGYMSCVDTCFDIGIATDRALHHFAVQLASTGSLPAQLTFNPEDRTSGNGSLMRLCPAPLLSLHLPAEDVVALARATSMPTHASRLCQDSCALFALYIYHLVRSTAPTPAERKRAVLDPNFIMLALHPEVDAIRRGFGWRGKKRDEISTSGFVLDTLRAALWGLDTFHSFEEGMMHLLGMGSDVDTVCAVYGQIAGACYGVEAIPARWRDGLAKKAMLDGFANRMVNLLAEKM